MRKILTGGLAALTLVGAIAAATDAGAASRRGDYRRDRGGSSSAIAAGALGLALGAALAGNSSGYYAYSRPYYRDSYYDRRYYAPRRGYYARTCEAWQWDPYYRRNVLVRYRC